VELMQEEWKEMNAPVGIRVLKSTRSRTVVVLLIGKSFLEILLLWTFCLGCDEVSNGRGWEDRLFDLNSLALTHLGYNLTHQLLWPMSNIDECLGLWK